MTTAQALPDVLKVAMAQILVEGGALEANLARADAAIAEASGKGAEVVVLPECLDAGWTHPSAPQLATTIDGPTVARLSMAAQASGLVVAAGFTERAGGKVFNSAVIVDSEGVLRAHHRKVNVLDLARDLYAVGDRMGVAATRHGRLGLNICADNFPGGLYTGKALAQMGARLLLSPSAWASDPDQPDLVGNPAREMWLDGYRQLADDHGLPVVAVTNVGPITGGVWQGRRCIGCSLAVGPSGELLAELSTEAEVRVVEVPLRAADHGQIDP
jgi:predicted amidohydrolase